MGKVMGGGYALRYFKRYDLNGHDILLEVYKKYMVVDYAPPAVEIGTVLQALSLDVQGEQDDITAPIVKTSLSMTFVDAPGVEDGKKTGAWEEFYTPDSTAYKVLLYIDGNLYWSGYITPDSFEEDLTYRGSVTLVARDNIGHLADFQFDGIADLDRMISVSSVIRQAWEKVDCQLNLTMAEGVDAVWPSCEGNTALSCLLNVEALMGKTWYDVLESVLDSFGLVLRYIGNNTAMVMPLRALPLLGNSDLYMVEVKEMLLEAGGHRMLTPALKNVDDTIRYDIGSLSDLRLYDRDYTPGYYRYGENDYARTWVFTDGASWKRAGEIGVINPFAVADTGVEDKQSVTSMIESSVYVSVADALTTLDNYIYSQIVATGSGIKVNLSFSVSRFLYSAESNILPWPGLLPGRPEDPYANTMTVYEVGASVTVTYQLIALTDNGVQFFTGTRWQESDSVVSETFYTGVNLEYKKEDIVLPDNSRRVELRLLPATVSDIYYESEELIRNAIASGLLYYRVYDVELTHELEEDYEYDRVNSIYDEAYNLTIKREPSFGPGPEVVSPKMIKNGIYLPDSYAAARKWQWPNGEETSLQALIAQQLLMYHSKPNSVITGTLLAREHIGEILDYNCLWLWNGKLLSLVSGQLDLLSGHIEGAKLREFLPWPEVWPEEGLMITEDGESVITHDFKSVNIGK